MNTVGKKVALLAAALLLIGSATANAQVRRGWVYGGPRAYFYTPFYQPFWGYYPYAGYPYLVGRPEADVRTQVTPKQAQVYVDGFYAGVADDFDGIFKRLHVAPGGHAITLYLEGYRTVTQDVYVRPDSTFKLNDTMERLPAGETSTPPPVPARAPGQAPTRPRQG